MIALLAPVTFAPEVIVPSVPLVNTPLVVRLRLSMVPLLTISPPFCVSVPFMTPSLTRLPDTVVLLLITPLSLLVSVPLSRTVMD
ncbi:hypothetical protein FVH03_03555 [Salmonella enterica]|nr:hypothetical protein [Salmonella enterica]